MSVKNILFRQLILFFPWSRRVTFSTVRHDIISGLIGALVVIPQGIAFATIAGLPPQYGLYAAMIPAIVAAFFGSSWHLISGPTTAISLVVLSVLTPFAPVASHGYVILAITLSFFVGIIQLCIGFFRLGIFLNYISHTVIIGFTAGAGILIAANQIKYFFDLSIPQHSSVLDIMIFLFTHIAQIQWAPVVVGSTALFVGIFNKKYFPVVPYMISAIIAGSFVGFIINFTSQTVLVKTISHFVASIPPLSLPDFSLNTFQMLFPGALSIAFLGLTEAVSIAKAISVRSGQKIDSNQEIIGQGLSNIVGSFFSAYPSSGSFNRSGLNFESGAKTPLAAIFSVFFLLVSLFFLADFISFIPLSVMAAILFLVAWGLIDRKNISVIYRGSKLETVVLFITLFSTLFLELTFAILFGVVLSLMVYLFQSSRVRVTHLVPDSSSESRRFSLVDTQSLCPAIRFFRIHGSLFFGSVSSAENLFLKKDLSGVRFVVLLLDTVPFIDVSGAEFLVHYREMLKKQGIVLVLSGVKEDTLLFLRNGGYVKLLDQEYIFNSKKDVIRFLVPRVFSSCSVCPHTVFKECPPHE